MMLTLRAICGVIAIMCAGTTAIAGPASPARAEPTPSDDGTSPYPEVRYFTEIDAEPYALPGQGFWFVTAQGLNCGIWFRGSFGCEGDIPGAPAGTHQIGWITGDARAHYDWTMAVRFPLSQGSIAIPPLTFIRSEGTTCSTTLDLSTYCEHGPFRFLITPSQTWLNG